MTNYSGTPPTWPDRDPGASGYTLPPPEPYVRTTYVPTAEQLARDAELQRYNKRAVIIPVVIAAAIALILFILLFVIAFGLRETGQAREFIAGMSALTIILMAIPLIFLMTIMPIAYLAWWANRRQQRKLYPETGPMAYRSRLQILLWQIDSFLAQAQVQIARGSDAVTKPLIRAHELWAYGEGFVKGVDENFTRSEQHDTNDDSSAGY